METDLEKNIPQLVREAHGKDHSTTRAKAAGCGIGLQKALYDLHKRKILLAIVVLAFTGLSSPSLMESDDLMVSESQILKNQLEPSSIDNDGSRHKPQRELYHFPKTEPSSLRRQAPSRSPSLPSQSAEKDEAENLNGIPQDEVQPDSPELGNATEVSDSGRPAWQLPWILPNKKKDDGAGDPDHQAEDTPSEVMNEESSGEAPPGSSLDASPELKGIAREVEPVAFAADQKYYNVELYIHCDDDDDDDDHQSHQNIGYTIYDKRNNQILSQKESLVDAQKVYVVPIPTGQYMVEVTDREGTGHGRYELWVNKVKLVDGSDFKYTSGVIEFKLFNNGYRKLVGHKKTQ